jgi:spermidine synthase
VAETDPGHPEGPPARPAPRFHVEDYDGHRALWADGVIFSVAVEPSEEPFGYWAAMLPEAPPETALLLGLGAGTLAHLLVRRAPQVRIVGVDNDRELVEFAGRHFDLALPNLEVVIGDAFEFVTACSRRFDYVAVDIFAGRIFHRSVLRRPFLRRLGLLTAPGGEIALNMFRDRRSESRVQRIGRVLPVARVERLPSNVVVHCRPEAQLPPPHPPRARPRNRAVNR